MLFLFWSDEAILNPFLGGSCRLRARVFWKMGLKYGVREECGVNIPHLRKQAPLMPLPIIHYSSIPQCHYYGQSSDTMSLCDSLSGLSG